LSSQQRRRLIRGAGPSVRSFGWGLLDQILSSLTNFLLGLLIARTVTARDLGAFGLAYATYSLALGATRALALEPLVVRFSAASEEQWRVAAGRASGTALAIGATIGIGILFAAAFAQGPLRSVLLVLGVTLPLLLLQDAWRFSFFALGTNARAFWNDAVWVAVLFPGAAMLLATGRQSIATLTAVWAAAGCAAAAVGFVQSGILPRPDHASRWLREQRDLTFRFLGEFIVSNGATQTSVFLIGLLATLADVGQLRAGQIILGPLNILFQGAGLVAVAETSRLLAQSPRRMHHAVYAISTILTVSTLAWAAVAFLLPASLGQALLRGNWAGGSALLLPLTISTVGYAFAYGAMTGLRALGAASSSLRARILDGFSLIILTMVGAANGGAMGVAWGHAVVGCLRILNWWWHFRRARRAYLEQRATAPDDLRLASPEPDRVPSPPSLAGRGGHAAAAKD
jgi:O-antigen/teichoic acid export membrane protein